MNVLVLRDLPSIVVAARLQGRIPKLASQFDARPGLSRFLQGCD